jgi:hypothetical protein
MTALPFELVLSLGVKNTAKEKGEIIECIGGPTPARFLFATAACLARAALTVKSRNKLKRSSFYVLEVV